MLDSSAAIGSPALNRDTAYIVRDKNDWDLPPGISTPLVLSTTEFISPLSRSLMLKRKCGHRFAGSRHIEYYGREMPQSGSKSARYYAKHPSDSAWSVEDPVPRGSRWMSVDPLAEKYPGWNPYNYVEDNPITSIDPNGAQQRPSWWDKIGSSSNNPKLPAGRYGAKTRGNSSPASPVPSGRFTGNLKKAGGIAVRVGVGKVVGIAAKKFAQDVLEIAPFASDFFTAAAQGVANVVLGPSTMGPVKNDQQRPAKYSPAPKSTKAGKGQSPFDRPNTEYYTAPHQ